MGQRSCVPHPLKGKTGTELLLYIKRPFQKVQLLDNGPGCLGQNWASPQRKYFIQSWLLPIEAIVEGYPALNGRLDRKVPSKGSRTLWKKVHKKFALIRHSGDALFWDHLSGSLCASSQSFPRKWLSLASCERKGQRRSERKEASC